jgi:hypothetical protein
MLFPAEVAFKLDEDPTAMVEGVAVTLVGAAVVLRVPLAAKFIVVAPLEVSDTLPDDVPLDALVKRTYTVVLETLPPLCVKEIEPE